MIYDIVVLIAALIIGIPFAAVATFGVCYFWIAAFNLVHRR